MIFEQIVSRISKLFANFALVKKSPAHFAGIEAAEYNLKYLLIKKSSFKKIRNKP